MDGNKNVYLTDDPWIKYFIHSADVSGRLSNETIENFREYIPVIFKYNLK